MHTTVPESGIIEYEMGYRADEFGDVLTGSFTSDKSAYRCQAVSAHYWRITRPETNLQIDITISDKPPRKIGLFVLPVLQVQFQLHDTSPELQTEFFGRFHQYFHKGGG